MKNTIHIERFLAMRGIQPKVTRKKPDFVRHPLQGVPWELISLPECSIAQQSQPCIAIHLKMVEITSTQQMCIPYSVTAPTCCLFALLEGELKLHRKDAQPMAQIDPVSLCLAYHAADEYLLSFPAGTHRFMMIEIEKNWPCNLEARLPAFSQLLDLWLHDKPGAFHLPYIALSKPIIELLDKMRFSQVRKIRDTITLLTSFEQCIYRYHKQLLILQRTTSDYLAEDGQLLEDYLLSYYNDDLALRIGAVLKHFGWTKNQLYRIAALHLHKTIHQYSSDLRIDRACLLLRKSNLSIAAISSEVGYIDPDYFSRLFKQKVGLSPTVYREAGD